MKEALCVYECGPTLTSCKEAGGLRLKSAARRKSARCVIRFGESVRRLPRGGFKQKYCSFHLEKRLYPGRERWEKPTASRATFRRSYNINSCWFLLQQGRILCSLHISNARISVLLSLSDGNSVSFQWVSSTRVDSSGCQMTHLFRNRTVIGLLWPNVSRRILVCGAAANSVRFGYHFSKGVSRVRAL